MVGKELSECRALERTKLEYSWRIYPLEISKTS